MSVGPYRVRPASPADLPALPALDASADRILDEAPVPLPSDAPSPGALAEAHAAGLLWVATAPGGDEPVGYAAAGSVEEGLFLGRLAVARAHQRRGVGATLLAAVVDRARWAYEPAVLLITDRDLPWNGPFYARYGFMALSPDRLPPGLATALALDRARHADPGRRIAMAKRL